VTSDMLDDCEMNEIDDMM